MGPCERADVRAGRVRGIADGVQPVVRSILGLGGDLLNNGAPEASVRASDENGFFRRRRRGGGGHPFVAVWSCLDGGFLVCCCRGLTYCVYVLLTAMNCKTRAEG